MFTIQQLKDAYSKVKSGADFPEYIREIKKMGVLYYETFVIDGHTIYSGINDHKAFGKALYETLQIAEILNIEQFKLDIKAHQNGETDYFTFCNDCTKSGIQKWRVCLKNMSCTYYDKAENEILVESVPD